MKSRLRAAAMLLLLIFLGIGVTGCVGYYDGYYYPYDSDYGHSGYYYDRGFDDRYDRFHDGQFRRYERWRRY